MRRRARGRSRSRAIGAVVAAVVAIADLFLREGGWYREVSTSFTKGEGREKRGKERERKVNACVRNDFRSESRSESKSKIAVTKTAHTNKGNLCKLIPLVLIFNTVVIKLIAPSKEETPARCKLKIARSTLPPE